MRLGDDVFASRLAADIPVVMVPADAANDQPTFSGSTVSTAAGSK
jgi:hypothetical protein